VKKPIEKIKRIIKLLIFLTVNETMFDRGQGLVADAVFRKCRTNP